MKIKFTLYLLYIALLSTVTLTAQTNSAYEGTRFLLSFMQNENFIQSNTGLLLELYITSKTTATISVRQPYTVPMNFTIPADSVLKVNINPVFEVYNSEVNLPDAIEVVSDQPITIYAYSSQYMSTDSYAVIPVDKWGTEHVVLSYPNDQYQNQPNLPPADSARNADPRRSEFLVIADNDSTIIEFKPKAVTFNGKQTYNTYKVRLNKKEVYLVQSFKSPKGTADLTGTIVKSNYPVGFLSGHVRTAIPQYLDINWDSKNHLVEMLQPVSSWGRNFATIPFFSNIKGDMIRGTSYYPNTTVYMQNSKSFQSFFLKDSGSIMTVNYVNEPTYWSSDKPVQLGQYMMHSGGNQDSPNFDPSYSVVPPVEQFVNKVTFMTPGNPPENPYQFDAHGALIITEEKTISDLMLDGFFVKDSSNILTQIIPSTNYHWVRLPFKAGKHIISSNKGKFTGILYGYGRADAYSHVLGSSIGNPFINDFVPPEVNFNFFCTTLTGLAKEPFINDQTGIGTAIVVLDSTFNFNYKVTPITDTTTEVSITANVIDITSDACFVIDIRDRNGNGNRYRFYYDKLNMNITQKIKFSNISAQDSVCQPVSIVNRGKDTITVLDIYLANKDSRLRYQLNHKPPYKLLPNDTISGLVCFDPRGDTNSVVNQFVVIMDCDRVQRIPITGNVVDYTLVSKGYDFGLVRLYDTLCAEVILTNKGNTPLNINSLDIPSGYKSFIFDTVGKFPFNLLPGDTLKIKVCYIPDSIKTNSFDVTFRDDVGIKKKATVSGSGGAPNVESTLIDWGKRRVGTANDTIFYLKNTGNYKCNLFFSTWSISIQEIKSDNITYLNTVLMPGDSIPIKASYNPLITHVCLALSEIKTDWVYHKPIEAKFMGEGVLPTITTFNIDFDTVYILSKTDSLCGIIQSGGNDILFIDKVIPISGDINSFQIDYPSLVGLHLSPDSLFKTKISFVPKRKGLHKLILEVTNDANPNYELKTLNFEVFGWAIPKDTLDYELTLDGNSDLNFCQQSELLFTLKNVGNQVLDINNIVLRASGATAQWIDKPALPFKLGIDESFSYKIKVDSDKSLTGTVGIDVTANDSIIKKIEKTINFKQFDLIIEDFHSFKAAPGDTVHYNISGKFPTRTDNPIEFKVTLEMDNRDFGLMNSDIILQLDDNGRYETINCKATQTLDKVVIIPEKSINLKNNGILWNFELPLFVYLNYNKYPPLKLQLSVNDCFISADKNVAAEITEVCVYPIRAIQLITNIPLIEINPNPVVDKLNFNIYLPEDEDIQIKIFDILGKKCYYSENYFLKKGNNSRIFEVSRFTNGMYVFSVQSSRFNKNLMFNIFK